MKKFRPRVVHQAPVIRIGEVLCVKTVFPLTKFFCGNVNSYVHDRTEPVHLGHVGREVTSYYSIELDTIQKQACLIVP
jgi:hypothetical protein